ncbi:7-dehydrocholesterol reductase [Marchantia polymorpha subsp. ruderalis]|uniref:7-dehydrocholesterol reductase n=2 Tax=Marchantia polymorpha TaxID=3197 RepID=A0A176WHA6_MARPO|nr:hypothetical protein AXG93_3384s1590 [Marchantia polymorpha subsp. ruderalis]PTQ45272.1 hypothetical protein MARPO_0015s0079 [Marchantia polymorpha]BBN01504.1 hypothetical protein Mp_2g07930 [Marchantia polymorpha subsp. ruderalis]|eukprot:PTQ45272.1 hypothetical protein MARPO_0015s0079 [Marchantia polymorpha]
MAKARSVSAQPKKDKVEKIEKVLSTKPLSAHAPIVTYVSMTTLLLLCPPFVIALWYTMVEADGSFMNLGKFIAKSGFSGFWSIWPRPTWTACKIILGFGAFEALLQVALPGEEYLGPLSPTGHRPVYKRNGFSAFIVTMVTYYVLWREKVFNPAIVYDHLGEILSALIFGSLAFCVLLYIKGHLAPSSTDGGTSGNVLVDFYWGMELYPRIGKWFDIKQFTNCRFGMMSWEVLALTYCIKQVELDGKLSDSMLVNTVLMSVYIAKFFWWEPGYMASMDIAHDRAGFYIVWGCLVWVPCIYTSPGMYLVKHPVELGWPVATLITLAGLTCIYINYECDYQRQLFRHTGGTAKIWGQVPTKIVAHYTTEAGEPKQSILLTSGWWGVSRHFHYVPEILAAFFWSLPALFSNFAPYFYTVFLTILLFDRAKRDDQRCRAKYQKYWDQYCKKVRYAIVPGIY